MLHNLLTLHSTFSEVQNALQPNLTSLSLRMTIRAVAYIRVLTEEQNPESQKVYLQEWASKHGIEIVAFYVDYAVSGYETHPFMRPGFRAAYEHAKREKLPILTISFDRICRRYKWMLEVLQKLKSDGIEIITVQEKWVSDLLSKIREIPDPLFREYLENIVSTLVFSSLAVTYEQFVRSLIEKIKAGMLRAKLEGKRIGRPSIMHDSKRQELFKLVVCKEKVPYRKAAELLGLTLKQVSYWAKKLCTET